VTVLGKQVEETTYSRYLCLPHLLLEDRGGGDGRPCGLCAHPDGRCDFREAMRGRVSGGSVVGEWTAHTRLTSHACIHVSDRVATQTDVLRDLPRRLLPREPL